VVAENPVADGGTRQRRLLRNPTEESMARGLLRSPRVPAFALTCALALLPLATPLAAPARPWTLPGDSVFLHVVPSTNTIVTAIVQDPQGFLWLGTQSGLERWDGHGMRTYAPDPGVAGALPDNNVTCLALDAGGRLWIGTSSGGLARYEPQEDSFSVLPMGPGGVRDPNVSALIPDGAGGLWIGSGAGLDHLDGKTGLVLADDAALADRRILALLRDRHGTIWAGTDKGLLRRAGDHGAFSAVPLPVPAGPAPGIPALFEDSAGRIWIGTRTQGAFVLEAGGGARAVRETGGGLIKETINSIVEARDGEVWLASNSSGIVRVDTTHGTTRRERHDDARLSSLASDEIYTLYRDRSGLLWVSSAASLSRIDPGQRAIDTYYGGSGPSRLVGSSVESVLTLPDGRVWVGVGGGGIDILDPSAGRVARMLPDPGRPDSALPKGRVEVMARAPDGSIYVGTRAGLYRAREDGQGLARIAIPGRNIAGDVTTLLVDDDRLWVGGSDGLWELGVPARGTPVVQRHLGAALGDPQVSVLERGRGSSLWVGTYEGLVHVDLRSAAVDRVPFDAIEKGARHGWDVSSVLIDRAGRLWVATFGHGILVEQGAYANGSPRFRRLGTREGLPQNNVDKLLLDAKGDVWASTDDGLALIDAEELTVRSFRSAQGAGITDYWYGVGAATPAGELLFGGHRGLTVVHPERVGGRAPAPVLAITDAQVSGAPIAAARLLSANDIEVPAGDRSLRVEFAALDFADPEHQRYSYRLRGFDRDWIDTPASQRLAVYTNLPPGDYLLELRSAVADGPWSQPLAVPVHVGPSWYQHNVVRAGAAVLLVALLAALVQLRTVVLRRREHALQLLVAERTAELEQRSDELRRSQEQLEKMAYFDSLTGLPNRRMFNDELRRLIAQSMRGQGDFVLLLVDLDGFKQVNDVQGHYAGDALLVAVAQRLAALMRETDRVARLGGDEFAVLLTHTCRPDAVEVACARMLAKLGEPMVLAGQTVQISASIGVAPYPYAGPTADNLYKAADVALYQAKRAGRNTWRWSAAEADAA
jgi:diguanylate cyclase (GGDEF)-like protein